MTSEPSGANWTDSKAAGPGGSTVVRLRAANDGSVLDGDPQDDELGFTIRVTGSTPGVTTWTADVFKKIDCDNDMGLTQERQGDDLGERTGHTDAGAHPDSDPDADAGPDADSDADADPDTDADADTDPDPDADAHADARDRDADRRHRPHADRDADRRPDRDADARRRPGRPARPRRRRPPAAPGASVAVATPAPSSSAPPGPSASPTTVEPTSAPTSDPGGRSRRRRRRRGDPPPGAAFTFEGGSGAAATDRRHVQRHLRAVHRDVRPGLRLGGPRRSSCRSRACCWCWRSPPRRSARSPGCRSFAVGSVASASVTPRSRHRR